MFSQYSWWDFVKFALALAIPYYAYVLIKYYREDIREWISNRGQKDPAPTADQVEEDEEEPSSSRFTVNDYSDEPTSVSQQPQSAEWLASPASAEKPLQFDDPEDQAEYELQGPDVKDQPEHFGMPVLIHTENLQEQSIDEVRSAAERLTKDEQGRVAPINANDKPAARIAEIINQQQDHPLDNFAFTR